MQARPDNHLEILNSELRLRHDPSVDVNSTKGIKCQQPKLKNHFTAERICMETMFC